MIHTDSNINLQATLSAASATPPPAPLPHHPITCQSELRYEDDGAFACEHATVPPGDTRTQACITHSIAMLIIELARRL